MRIAYVLGFEHLEVFLGSRTQNRLFQLSSTSSTPDCRYYIVVSSQISDEGISVTVRSPFQVINQRIRLSLDLLFYLQITNDLFVPVNLCFKKSALCGVGEERPSSPTLSILSLGSTSNPFDDFPPMVTLQPDQTFSVPLLVAYHSPIYISPSTFEY